jgi:hypothetical protein
MISATRYNGKVDTCEGCIDCGHCGQPLVINISHSLYQDQVAKGTHSDHLSA